MGIEGANCEIVDNLVQRDPVTNFPIIKSSSLIGAFRKYAVDYQDYIHLSNDDFIKVFGANKKSGKCKFSSAQLLTYPVRSKFQPFISAICPAILKNMVELFADFNLNDSLYRSILKFNNFVTNELYRSVKDFLKFIDDEIYIENWENSAKINYEFYDDLADCFGRKENLVILKDSLFAEVCKNLPVISRSNIDNYNKNLCYEEIIPSHTRFWFAFFCESGCEIFDKIIDIGEAMQIGIHQNIGYGYFKIMKL